VSGKDIKIEEAATERKKRKKKFRIRRGISFDPACGLRGEAQLKREKHQATQQQTKFVCRGGGKGFAIQSRSERVCFNCGGELLQTARGQDLRRGCFGK